MKKGGANLNLNDLHYPIPPIGIAPRDGFDFKSLLEESGVGCPPVIDIC